MYRQKSSSALYCLNKAKCKKWRKCLRLFLPRLEEEKRCGGRRGPALAPCLRSWEGHVRAVGGQAVASRHGGRSRLPDAVPRARPLQRGLQKLSDSPVFLGGRLPNNLKLAFDFSERNTHRTVQGENYLQSPMTPKAVRPPLLGENVSKENKQIKIKTNITFRWK